MVGAGIGVGIVPQAVAVRCARAAGIKRIALSDAWAARSLMLCVRELEALPVPTRQLVRYLQGARDSSVLNHNEAVVHAGERPGLAKQMPGLQYDAAGDAFALCDSECGYGALAH